MFSYNKMLFTIWAAIFCYLVFDIEEGDSMLGGFFDQIIPSASHPWLIFWYGIGIGLFVILWIINWIEQAKEYEKFYTEIRDFALGDERSKFFMYLSRAYEKWKEKCNDAPESLEKLMEKASYPDWLPVLNDELLNEIDKQYLSGIDTPYIWRFAYELYCQVDDFVKKRKSPELLLDEEAIMFHEARQRLSYFWESTGNRVLVMKKLRFWRIKPLMKPEARLLKMLTYLSLALHTVNMQQGQGSKHLYYLCGMYFGTRKWGLKQFLCNPLLDGWDKLRE